MGGCPPGVRPAGSRDTNGRKGNTWRGILRKSLRNMSERIKSYKLSRSIKLMIQGMRSGGELPTVLQEIASDIRTEQNLFKRMSAQTTSQAMFITIRPAGWSSAAIRFIAAVRNDIQQNIRKSRPQQRTPQAQ